MWTFYKRFFVLLRLARVARVRDAVTPVGYIVSGLLLLYGILVYNTHTT